MGHGVMSQDVVNVFVESAPNFGTTWLFEASVP